jgi:hypothetical protein
MDIGAVSQMDSMGELHRVDSTAIWCQKKAKATLPTCSFICSLARVPFFLFSPFDGDLARGLVDQGPAGGDQ